MSRNIIRAPAWHDLVCSVALLGTERNRGFYLATRIRPICKTERGDDASALGDAGKVSQPSLRKGCGDARRVVVQPSCAGVPPGGRYRVACERRDRATGTRPTPHRPRRDAILVF